MPLDLQVISEKILTADLLTGWMDSIGLSSVLRPRQHSIGYMGDGFYRSKDPTDLDWRKSPSSLLSQSLG